MECDANGGALSPQRPSTVLAAVKIVLLMSMTCLFCGLPENRVLFRNDAAIVIRDAFPVSPGHTLVIPLKHVESLFETSAEDRAAMFELLNVASQQLKTEFAPAGYNIGINDGAAAGQTIRHLHMHLIPRYAGDRADPRGGVRWIIPEKADYWSAAERTKST